MMALDGIKVLDFGRYVAGPYCATLLADFGADVIRIEPPGGGEDRALVPAGEDEDGALFLQMGRNKRSITLDLHSPEADEVKRRLVDRSDVVICNVPDKALARMGLDYETLRAIRPDIILTNISSFGPIGPWADRPGFDSVGQAMCGSAYLSGEGDIPYRTPITWVDHATAVYAAFGTMVALMERERSGAGQQVDCSLLGSALAFSATFLVEQALGGVDRTAIGNRSFLNGPTDTFRTKDGWIVTQVVGQKIFERWVTLMSEPEWLDDPRFADDQARGDNGELLSQRMAAWCEDKSSQQALAQLAEARIPAGPVLSPQAALDHEQVGAMGLITPTPTADKRVAPLFGPPISLRRTPGGIRSAAPAAGEDTQAVLREIGFDEEGIARIRAAATGPG